jgi:hypothetical protein
MKFRGNGPVPLATFGQFWPGFWVRAPGKEFTRIPRINAKGLRARREMLNRSLNPVQGGVDDGRNCIFLNCLMYNNLRD